MRNIVAALSMMGMAAEAALPEPTELRTAAPFTSSASIELIWNDVSEGESGFEIEYSVNGVDDWTVITTTLPNQTRTTFTGGGGTLYFRIRSLSPDDDHSEFSAPVSVTLPTTVAMAAGVFGGGPVGTPITVAAPSISRAPDQTGELTFSAEELPEGLSIDSTTGVISGTPTQVGVFRALRKVDDENSVASSFVTFRFVPSSSGPSLRDDLVLVTSQTKTTFSFSDLFEDFDTESAARVVTNAGTVDVVLYPQAAPNTVANFLRYVDDGAYTDVIFHRSVATGLSIVQAGFLKPDPEGASDAYSTLDLYSPIANEPGLPNLRGTIAPAKTSDPNSATSQWFFNTIDNRTALDSPSNSGGFSVFGRASDLTLPVLDVLQAKPTGNYPLSINGSATTLNDWPTLVNPSGSSPDPSTDLVQIESVSRISPVSATLVDTNGPISASLSGETLELIAGEAGTATLSFDLVDLDGNEALVSLEVSVLDFQLEVEESAPESARFSFEHLKTTPGFRYQVQTSRDLESWDSFWTTDDGFEVPEIAEQTDLGDRWKLSFATVAPSSSEEPLFFRVLAEKVPD
ncbi:peptidylprolyl isomerase [Roseibacillus persicicus]|nr:peptidylprolyl isomerase [Roseibacillus persicicus]